MTVNYKKIGKTIFYPHIAVAVTLIPVSILFLAYSMAVLGAESPVAVVSYVISAYALTVWCVRIPTVIKFFKAFKTENKLAVRWQNDTRLRVNVSLISSLVWNVAYALFQLALGFLHSSFWFYSLSGYYLLLAVMRLLLFRYTAANTTGASLRKELLSYRFCGIILLFMNTLLSLIVFFMVYWNRSFPHGEIVTITIAAYTFASLTVAIVNTLKYKKHKSPVYSASKMISLAAASVSVLTLESTMLTTFGETDALTRRLMLAFSGGAVSVFVVAMAVYMIVGSTKKLKFIRSEENINGKQ